MPIPYERMPSSDDDEGGASPFPPTPEEIDDDIERESGHTPRFLDEYEEMLEAVSSPDDLMDDYAAEEDEAYDERDGSGFGFGDPPD
jgi:hypothetical protein